MALDGNSTPSDVLNDGHDAITIATRRFMNKSMKGGKGVTKAGFKGGGKDSGFVNTPMNAPKKGVKFGGK